MNQTQRLKITWARRDVIINDLISLRRFELRCECIVVPNAVSNEANHAPIEVERLSRAHRHRSGSCRQVQVHRRDSFGREEIEVRFRLHRRLQQNSHKMENCTICDLAVENDENDYFLEPIISISTSQEIFSEERRIIAKVHSLSSFNVHFGLFGRPPPSLG